MSKKYSLEPLGNYVIIDLIEEAEKVTTGGIIIPDQAKEKPQMAKVIAAGPGLISAFTGETLAPIVRPGDLVLINKYAGQPLDVPGYEKLVIIMEGDVLSIIKELEDSEDAKDV